MHSNASAADMRTALGIDGTTEEDQGGTFIDVAAGTQRGFTVFWSSLALSEGMHDFRILGSTTAGTGTWTGASANGRVHFTVIAHSLEK